MQIIDYYAILAVSPNATISDIRKAYRRLAFHFHPDRNKDPDSVLIMQMLNEAYSVLNNPLQRARYDYWRKHNEPVTSKPRDFYKNKLSPYHQIGTLETISSPITSETLFTKTAHIVGQSIYRLVYDLAFGFITVLPYKVLFILYFFLIGSFLAWINPKILGLRSDDMLVVTNFSASILSLFTMWQLQRKGVLVKLWQNNKKSVK